MEVNTQKNIASTSEDSKIVRKESDIADDQIENEPKEEGAYPSAEELVATAMAACTLNRKGNCLSNFFRKFVPIKSSYVQAKSVQLTELRNLIRTGKPSYDEVHKWGKSFDALLDDKYGLALFRDFLSTEFSDENIEFWIACEEYRTLKQAKKIQIQAQKIFHDFIAVQSKREVNLDSKTRLKTEKDIENPTIQTFDLAQKRIQALMEKDSYRRFLRSDVYHMLLKESKIAAKAMAVAARMDKGTGNKNHNYAGVMAAAADAEAGANSVEDLQLLGLSTSRFMRSAVNGNCNSVSSSMKSKLKNKSSNIEDSP